MELIQSILQKSVTCITRTLTDANTYETQGHATAILYEVFYLKFIKTWNC